MKKNRLIIQLWKGTSVNLKEFSKIVPGGFSLHLSDECREKFIKNNWHQMSNPMPDRYSAPKGTPYEIEVDAETFKKVSNSISGSIFDCELATKDD